MAHLHTQKMSASGQELRIDLEGIDPEGKTCFLLWSVTGYPPSQPHSMPRNGWPEPRWTPCFLWTFCFIFFWYFFSLLSFLFFWFSFLFYFWLLSFLRERTWKSCEKGKNMNKLCHIKIFIRDRKKNLRSSQSSKCWSKNKIFFKKLTCNK